MNKSVLQVAGVVVGGVVVVMGIGAVASISVGNTAIQLESQIDTAKSNINKEQNRRVTLFNNMVDAVQSYNQYEGDTLNKITKARTEASKGNVDGANTALNVVVERYPDLKSQANYKQTLTEFSSTENRLADYVEAYNDSVRDYRTYTRKFPNSWFLSMTGHPVKSYEQSGLTVNLADATNLFGK